MSSDDDTTKRPQGAAHADPLARLGKGPVALLFGATWCIPYRLTDPLIDEVTAAGGEVRRVDVDEFPHHAETFRIISLPTLVRVVAGTEKSRLVGAFGRSEMFRAAGLAAPRAKKSTKPR